MPQTKTVKFNVHPPGVLVEQGLTVSPFYIAHYGKLVGKTITEVRLERSETSEPQPVLGFKDGTTASVLCDPEGNGPGHLDIQEG